MRNPGPVHMRPLQKKGIEVTQRVGESAKRESFGYPIFRFKQTESKPLTDLGFGRIQGTCFERNKTYPSAAGRLYSINNLEVKLDGKAPDERKRDTVRLGLALRRAREEKEEKERKRRE
ncbi:hypothetical protein GCK32_000736 [Trichostrongylus colubriformis]|uniref:Uncharacterized protein n=1 Tax=Trichostrongylus colubriformis TaxID=6319 RepID=A0AAN8IYF9_TRICO